MNKKVISLVFLIVGVVLLVLGFQELETFGSRLSRAVGRGPSPRAVDLLITGGACTAFGGLRLFKNSASTEQLTGASLWFSPFPIDKFPLFC